jgi:dTDP-4-dehydrorhamnose reductase
VKILLTGRNGQVGWELERALPALGEVIATDRSSLDVSDPDSIRRVVREAKPGIIVNAAAYTAVDKAESEPELAMRINGAAPGILAEEAKRLGALLVHYSTDYVFDGSKPTAYREDDAPNPLNAYGKTKLEGERMIQAAGCRHLTVRTSWVYGARGRNFVRTVLRLAREQAGLRIVADQFGAPTSAEAIAGATLQMLRRPDELGTFHMSAGGKTSWQGFAQAIVDCTSLGTPVVAIRSEEFPTPARRPPNSVLDCSKLKAAYRIELAHWRDPLPATIQRLRDI